jgi:phosphoesterase RecJ-like protein
VTQNLSTLPYQDLLPKAVHTIQEAQKILVVSHINPDGDTLGCLLTLGIVLERLGKTTTLLSADGVPPTLMFLPQVEAVQTTTEERGFDLAIVVDAGELNRVGKSREAVESAATVMDIDHHVTPGAFGEIRLLDAKAAATGEILFDLLHALSVEITPDIAQCLLCALLTDTGSFRYLNVTPRTLQIASVLVEKGGVPNEIAEAVFENKPFAAQKLLGRALDSLARTDDGRIAWAHITQEDFVSFDATDADTEGIVNAVRSVRGTQVAFFLREMPSGKLRVSLRAQPPYDVASVALQFGGGGHHLAAGCTLEGPIADAEARLVSATQVMMTATDSPTSLPK